jgi:hypothetical protein
MYLDAPRVEGDVINDPTETGLLAVQHGYEQYSFLGADRFGCLRESFQI